VPVTIHAIIGSEDIIDAMDLRCFGTRPRTWLYKLTYHWWDYALIAFGLLMLVAGILTKSLLHIGGFWVPGWWIRLAGGE